MNNRKRLQRLIASPANVRFGDMVTLAEAFGFTLLRRSGSHHIYVELGFRCKSICRTLAAKRSLIR